jgi:uncharacterized protein (DUF934 family)
MALIRRRPAQPDAIAKSAFELASDRFAHADLDGPLPEGPVVVPLARLVRDAAALKGRPELGVRVPSDTRLEALLPFVAALSRIEIEVPKFADGRVYSLARRLRDQAGYGGELVAAGDVLRDQVLYYVRCGFDGLDIAPQKSAEDALKALDELPVFYQAAHLPRLPLSRRVQR